MTHVTYQRHLFSELNNELLWSWILCSHTRTIVHIMYMWLKKTGSVTF